ncbi:hypothetical protein [Kiloniella sp.]|uniref:hypothetical protein n=1 Tax=Kiloniella sp. TaxID=1938587 RepID=UPI003B0226B9
MLTLNMINVRLPELRKRSYLKGALSNFSVRKAEYSSDSLGVHSGKSDAVG